MSEEGKEDGVGGGLLRVMGYEAGGEEPVPSLGQGVDARERVVGHVEPVAAVPLVVGHDVLEDFQTQQIDRKRCDLSSVRTRFGAVMHLRRGPTSARPSVEISCGKEACKSMLC